MSLRAIFRFENLDSTKDLNDRFSGLFKAGIYEGGAVKINSSNTAAIVEPFKALTADGMAVISDEEIIVPNIPSTTVNIWIVLEAYYVIDSNPVMRLKVIDREQNIDPSIHVRLAKKISTTSYDYLNDGCVDKVDPIGRNHYRGVLSSNEFNSMQDSFAVFDWCFEVSPTTVMIKLKLENGFAYYTSSNVVDNRINNHIQNFVDNTAGYVSDMGGAGDNGGMPNLANEPLMVLDGGTARACDIGNENFGSFNITSNKWFALDSIKTKWTQSQTGFKYSSSSYSYSSLESFINSYFAGTVGTGTHSRGLRFINATLLAAPPSQDPSVDVRFITEHYPLLPTLDEKFALVGNYTDDSLKPSQDNPFVTKKTGSLVLKTLTFTSVSPYPVNGYYVHSLDAQDIFIFINSIGEASSFVYPIFEDDDIPSDNPIRWFSTNTTAITTADLANAADGIPTEFVGKVLRNTSYVIKSTKKLSSIKVYVLKTIGNEIPAPLYPDSQFQSTKCLLLHDDNNHSGMLKINSDNELEFTNSNGTYKVMLIKQ